MNSQQLYQALIENRVHTMPEIPIQLVDPEGNIWDIDEITLSHLNGGAVHLKAKDIDE